uniref:non-specific serine/threonine protein kinase n=1 Tax=Alexandrium catenella TaxID=2925 RepID=A0A7S1W8M6_ALECA|mmetsp:Transcript_43543/g.117439  ORF Transcript_43543/g.117439 Transcript_43543/m.117439 type:complete len:668 (+) Transcript_43543:109-2112(+)
MPTTLTAAASNSETPQRSPLHRSPPCTPQVHGGQPGEQPVSRQATGNVRSFFVQKSAGRPGLTYEPVQKLGEGAFGVAHLVRDKRSGLLRVLKTINKRQSQVPPNQLEREIKNLKACDHPHIIRLFEYYEDYENVYLIMERAAGGELHQVLQQQRARGMHLPERWVSIVIRQCLQAIAYVHSQGIMHKDLKSENILLLHPGDVDDPLSQPHAVIIDLGIAELFSARLGRRARCTVVAGTPTHMAPEVWRGNFGPVADVWSLGVVMFELLGGEIPFLCSSLNSCQEWIRLHRQGPNWSLLSHTSAQARAFCQRMLSCDERMRPTAQQCLGHSWFKAETEASTEVAPEASDMAAAEPAENEASRGDEELLGRLKGDLEAYQGRSKFEKAVLLQVASEAHMSQVGRLADVFNRFDGDQSGTLSAPEFVGALRDLGVEQTDAESYAACLDVNANGRIEYTEFYAACIGLLYESLRGVLWQSFCVIDVDGNGVLTREEILAVVSRAELVAHGFQGGDASTPRDEWLDRMELDESGNISFDELCRHLLPSRPALASPRRRGSTDVDEQAVGWSPSAAANHQPAQALRDEEFAQLLDEIEADHDAKASEKVVSPKAARENDLNTDHPMEEDDRGQIITPVAQLLAQTPEPMITSSNLSVDEELSHLLADIANGP